jgi:hypothetical protein
MDKVFFLISSLFNPDFLETHFTQIISRFYPDFGGFLLLDLIITELKSHMTC